MIVDKRKIQEAKSKARIPVVLAVVLAVFALIFTDSIAASIFTLFGFLIGYMPVEKMAYWVDSLEEQRQLAKSVLLKFTDPEIVAINSMVLDGRKIEAIKTIRAKTGIGLREAKLAVDLLEDFGLRWLEVLEEKV